MKNQPGNHEKPWKTNLVPWKTIKTMKNQPETMKNHEKHWKNMKNGVGQERKNVTHAGSQLTSEMGEGVGQE